MIARSLGRKLDHRQSMLANLATSLILYERVITTTAKAKEVKAIVEKWINIGKGESLVGHRRLLGLVKDRNAAKKIKEELALRYRDIPGGYLTRVSLGPRRGDGAEQSLLELRPVQASLQKAAPKDKPARPSLPAKRRHRLKKTTRPKKRPQ